MKVPRNRSEKIKLMRNKMRETKAIIYETLYVELDEKKKKIIYKGYKWKILYIFRIIRTIKRKQIKNWKIIAKNER